MISIEQKMKSIKFYKLFGYSCYRPVSVEKVIMAQFPFWTSVIGGARAFALEKKPTKLDIVVLLSTFISMLYYTCVYHSVTNWYTSRDVCLWHEL